MIYKGLNLLVKCRMMQYWRGFTKSDRRGLNLREMNVDQALHRDDSFMFTKIQYLKLGSSGLDLSVSQFLQEALRIEYLLSNLKKSSGLRTNLDSHSSLLNELLKRGIINGTHNAHLQEIARMRNELVHNRTPINHQRIQHIREISRIALDKLEELQKITK